MKWKLVTVVLSSLLTVGCGMLFDPDGDGPGSDNTYNPETERTEGNFSFSFHGGVTHDFPEGELKIASAWYDGANTNILLKATKRIDGTFAYLYTLRFPGDLPGTFTNATGEFHSTFASYNGEDDGGLWEGNFTSSPQGDCTAEQLAEIETGFVSVTGYGSTGQRIVGTFDITYNQTMGCGTLRRFHGSFDVVRDQ